MLVSLNQQRRENAMLWKDGGLVLQRQGQRKAVKRFCEPINDEIHTNATATKETEFNSDGKKLTENRASPTTPLVRGMESSVEIRGPWTQTQRPKKFWQREEAEGDRLKKARKEHATISPVMADRDRAAAGLKALGGGDTQQPNGRRKWGGRRIWKRKCGGPLKTSEGGSKEQGEIPSPQSSNCLTEWKKSEKKEGTIRNSGKRTALKKKIQLCVKKLIHKQEKMRPINVGVGDEQGIL